MSDADQANIDRIERDRRRRERELLLLLLALCTTSRNHAVYAARSGNDPAAAARMVILGDSGGHFVGVAPIIVQAQADAYLAGFRRTLRLVGVDTRGQNVPTPDPEDVKEAIAAYKAAADQYAGDLADTVGNGIRQAEAAATDPKEELTRIRFVFRNGQLTRQHFGRLAADAETSVCEAYSDGMMGGYYHPAIRLLVKGLRHESILDERTTDICRERDGVALPLNHSYWNRNRPPLHWRCRSILLPILKDFTPTPDSELPIIAPMPGFGR